MQWSGLNVVGWSGGVENAEKRYSGSLHAPQTRITSVFRVVTGGLVHALPFIFFLFPGKGDYYRYLNEIQNRNSRERRDDLRKKTEEAYRTIRPSRPPTSYMHNPHIQYDWAWCSTSLCSTTRSLIPQKRPLNWRGQPLTSPWLTGVWLRTRASIRRARW